jgi:signal transduction histidine kinase
MTEAQSEKLERLVNDMLDVSRIKTGRLTMVHSEFNFYDLVVDVLNRMNGEFTHAGSIPDFVFNSNRVFGKWDYLRVEQVFINLLTNSLRYGKGRPIEVRLVKNENNIVLSVHDHGIGIAKDKLDKIFNRFERAVERSEVSGLGLGLFISKQIVGAHKGKIWAESELEKGSNFYVELPIFPSK